MGGAAEVAIIDRDSGAVLSPHYYRGEYWVAGRPGARYSIQIRNRLGERLLAVTSVDGVNVVSGATAGWDQTGYVFGPGESYQITGWRKTDSEVAAFTFTDSPNSYAQRTGRPANIGVIGVAIFRERQPQPAYVPPMIARPTDQAASTAGRASEAAESADAKALPAAPSPLAEGPTLAGASHTAGSQARHRAMASADVLLPQPYRILTHAGTAERSHSHSLRQLGTVVRHGHRQAAAPGGASDQPVPGRSRAAICA